MVKVHEEIEMVKKVVEGRETEVEKKWMFFEMAPYTFITFGEYFERVLQIGRGYREIGLGVGDRVHVFAATR